jgi:hypothetical protein
MNVARKTKCCGVCIIALGTKKTGATSENSEKNAFTAWRLMEVMVMAVWQQS